MTHSSYTPLRGDSNGTEAMWAKIVRSEFFFKVYIQRFFISKNKIYKDFPKK